jgi:hypothetical protein
VGKTNAVECIISIENQKVMFHPGSIMIKEHVYEVYKNRYEIQRNVTNALVSGYDEILVAIEKYLVDKIWVLTLTADNGYIIFCDENLSVLLGILKSPHSNFQETLRFRNENLAKGIYSDSIVLFNGKFLKE